MINTSTAPQHLDAIVRGSLAQVCSDKDRKPMLEALEEFDELMRWRADTDLLRKCADGIAALKAAGIVPPPGLEREAVDKFLPAARESLQTDLHHRIVARLEARIAPLLQKRNREMAERLEAAADQIEEAARKAAKTFGLPAVEPDVCRELKHAAGWFRERGKRRMHLENQSDVRRCLSENFESAL
jgi:hypothetical protein